MEIPSNSKMKFASVMRQRDSADGEEEMERLSPISTKPRVLDGFCLVTLNIGGRNTNPVEFVLEGDESDLGVACTALGVQLLEGMGSDTVGPGSMRELERRAVDAVLADLGSDEAIAKLLDEPTWVRVYEIVRLDTD